MFADFGSTANQAAAFSFLVNARGCIRALTRALCALPLYFTVHAQHFFLYFLFCAQLAIFFNGFVNAHSTLFTRVSTDPMLAYVSAVAHAAPSGENAVNAAIRAAFRAVVPLFSARAYAFSFAFHAKVFLLAVRAKNLGFAHPARIFSLAVLANLTPSAQFAATPQFKVFAHTRTSALRTLCKSTTVNASSDPLAFFIHLASNARGFHVGVEYSLLVRSLISIRDIVIVPLRPLCHFRPVHLKFILRK